ncbi:hypothetical protein MMC24_000306 [Lignoscripta atroalba]|nr:hypothetical protein [Lignoscripta atroalba]
MHKLTRKQTADARATGETGGLVGGVDNPERILRRGRRSSGGGAAPIAVSPLQSPPQDTQQGPMPGPPQGPQQGRPQRPPGEIVTTFPLMALPAEVRLNVYQQLFQSPHPIPIPSKVGPIRIIPAQPVSRPPVRQLLQILRVSRQVHIEACPVFYRINTFLAGSIDDLNDLFTQLNQEGRNSIQRLVLLGDTIKHTPHCLGINGLIARQNLMTALSNFPNLASITFALPWFPALQIHERMLLEILNTRGNIELRTLRPRNHRAPTQDEVTPTRRLFALLSGVHGRTALIPPTDGKTSELPYLSLPSLRNLRVGGIIKHADQVVLNRVRQRHGIYARIVRARQRLEGFRHSLVQGAGHPGIETAIMSLETRVGSATELEDVRLRVRAAARRFRAAIQRSQNATIRDLIDRMEHEVLTICRTD